MMAILEMKSPHSDAMRWADVHEHGKGTEGSVSKHGDTLTVAASPFVECWLSAVGADTIQSGDSFSFRIDASRLDMGDAMLLGVVDGSDPDLGARESRRARAVVYHPRAGEVWAFDKGRVVLRVPMAPSACLFGHAVGAEVHVRLVDANVALRVNDTDEVVVPFAMPPTLRPCARLGKAGDAITLRKTVAPGGATEGRGPRAERTSNDTVISTLPA